MNRAAFTCALCLVAAAAWAQRPVPAPTPAMGSVQVGFAPWDDVEGMIVTAVNEAQREVLVQAFSFTNRAIAAALIGAMRRGVRVEVLADREQTMSGEGSRIPELARAGIPVYLEVRYAAAHSKVMIIDGRSRDPTVITGSANWTAAAQRRNSENVIILRGNRAVVSAYLENWERHRGDALPYAKR